MTGAGQGATGYSMPSQSTVVTTIVRLQSPDVAFEHCDAAAEMIETLFYLAQGPTGFATWKDAALAERTARAALLLEVEGLRTLVQRYASECGECGGTGTLDLTTGNTIFKTADFYPRCPACADIRAALSPASGGV